MQRKRRPPRFGGKIGSHGQADEKQGLSAKPAPRSLWVLNLVIQANRGRFKAVFPHHGQASPLRARAKRGAAAAVKRAGSSPQTLCALLALSWLTLEARAHETCGDEPALFTAAAAPLFALALSGLA